jgi:hypothetical protein
MASPKAEEPGRAQCADPLFPWVSGNSYAAIMSALDPKRSFATGGFTTDLPKGGSDEREDCATQSGAQN